MIVQISLSGNLFVFRKKSVSPAFAEKCFYHLLLVSFIVQKKFSWKNLSKKLFSWRKTKLLLSPLDFCSIFILSKNSFLFFSVLLFFQLSCYLFFLLFLIVFSGVCFSKQKNGVKKSFEKHIGFFQHFLLNLFFGGGNIFWSQESVQKLTFVFSSKILP